MEFPMTPRSTTRIVLVLSVFLGLAACETVEGLGQDVQSGGAAISDAANDVQRDL
jgi:predicted small secreted protein